MEKYEYKIACPAEVARAQKLIFEVYCEEVNFFKPSDYPSGKVGDIYDERSAYFVALDEDKVVATTRITSFQKNARFWSQEKYSFPEELITSSTAELSRFATLKQYRNMSGATIKLFDFVLRYCESQKIDYLITLSNYPAYIIYKKIGIPFIFLGNPIILNGYKTMPLILDITGGIYIIINSKFKIKQNQ